MKASISSLSGCLLLLCSCASPNRPQASPGAQGVGVPSRAVDSPLATANSGGKADDPAINLPDKIVIPADYKLMLLDGRLTLVRETDPRTIDPGPSSLRVITDVTDGGDLSYQPALLPQELAAEVASYKESSARMDNALDSVMQRSRELSDQAAELEVQAKRLGELMAASQAKSQTPANELARPTSTTAPNHAPGN
jgi:hypothetical protein